MISLCCVISWEYRNLFRILQDMNYVFKDCIVNPKSIYMAVLAANLGLNKSRLRKIASQNIIEFVF